MTDRELLELAAKAAGYSFDGQVLRNNETDFEYDSWNPLTDDGDAFRLAVKCGISVLRFSACIGTGWPQNGLPARLIGFDPPYEDISSGQDVFAATRRAITRAAAELGKNL
jgi:hypothetical protein